MMEADSYEGKALEAQALHDMEFMRETDQRGDTRYTCRPPKPEPYRLATASQLDWLRGLLPALLMATSAVGTVLLALIVCGLLWWPRCAVCGKRHTDLRTLEVEVDGDCRHVCFGCMERILVRELSE